jgi:prenyltransferase/squalene oxidase-like repeat protein
MVAPGSAAASRARPAILRVRVVLVGAAVALLALAAPVAAVAPDDTNRLRLERTVRFLQDTQNLDGGYGGRPGGESDVMMSCWVALAVASFGINPQDQAQPGGVDVWTYIERHTATYDQTSDYERTLLAALATGEDGRDVGGTDLVARILERQLPDGGFPQRPGQPSWVNSTAFALLPLSRVADPAAAVAVQRAADWLIAHQEENGSWRAFSPSSPPDADMTAAVIQALNRAGRHGSEAERHALEWLRTMQNDDGGFTANDAGAPSNTGTTAWVAQGLWAAGIDPRTWRRSGGDPLDYLESMRRADGAITWSSAQPNANPTWMTAYAAPAFAGQPLPIAAPPRAVKPPTPEPPTESGPGVIAPDPQAGEGGLDGAAGGGVIAGGGGRGARSFSRPQPQSRGDVAGGVRRARPLTARERRARQRTAHERRKESTRRREAHEPSPAVPAPTATSNGAAASGVTATPSAADRPGAGSGSSGSGSGHDGRAAAAAASAVAGGEVTGRVIGGADAGTPGTSRTDGIAPGLLGAQAGGRQSSDWAIGIACGLLLCAAGGSRWERRARRRVRLT